MLAAIRHCYTVEHHWRTADGWDSRVVTRPEEKLTLTGVVVNLGVGELYAGVQLSSPSGMP